MDSNLANFIGKNTEPILDAWDKYAVDIISAHPRSADARDHAMGILRAIITDMQKELTAEERSDKSQGVGPQDEAESQANLHGAERQMAGFSMPEEVSEFRALRATIMRLWNDSSATAMQSDIDGMIRFNEAIDKVLAESVVRYASDKDDFARRLESDLKRELNETSVELHALTAQVIKLQDKERRQLAAELHDIVGQTLGALAAEIGLLRYRLRNSGDEESLSGLDRANELAKQAMRSMRQVKTELHPLGIEVAGWPAILRWYGEATQARTGVSVTVLTDARLPRPAPEVADELVRIYLEVLSNIAKHAKARNIEVTLKTREDQMVFAIADDGCGFDVSRPRVRGSQSGWGIAIMRERAAVVGGVLQLRSKPGDGTHVEIVVPLSQWS